MELPQQLRSQMEERDHDKIFAKQPSRVLLDHGEHLGLARYLWLIPHSLAFFRLAEYGQPK